MILFVLNGVTYDEAMEIETFNRNNPNAHATLLTTSIINSKTSVVMYIESK